MQLQPVNLSDVLGIVGGMLIVLIPVIGVTIRFAAKPLVEALKAVGVLGPQSAVAGSASARDVELLSRRVLELEQEVAKLKAPALPTTSSTAMDAQVVPIDRQVVR